MLICFEPTWGICARERVGRVENADRVSMTPRDGCRRFRDLVWQNERWLRGAWVLKLVSEAAAELTSFGEYFLARGLGEREHHFLVFQRVQEGDVVLIINDDDGEDRP